MWVGGYESRPRVLTSVSATRKCLELANELARRASALEQRKVSRSEIFSRGVFALARAAGLDAGAPAPRVSPPKT
jgi:hypothetical protein